MITDLSKVSFQALDDLPVGVLWFDSEARFIEVNKEACRNWGYTKEEFLGLTIFDINPTMKAHMWKAHWQKKQKDPSTFESRHRRKNGEEFPVSITDIFVNHEGETISCAIVTDITQRKEGDRQARLSDFTVQKAGDAVFWLCPKGNIKQVNEEAIHRYGYTREEFQEMNVLKISGDVGEEEFADIWQKLKVDKKLKFETNHYSKAGTKIDVEISANYIQFESMDFACALIRDITVRKRKEAALRGALMEIRELKSKIEEENNYLQEELKVQHNFDEIVSVSPKFLNVLKQIEVVADTTATVLVTGESGTGKELISRALHQLSKRSERPMIKINCAALPVNLIESELFGHEKGAFTGAIEKKIGKFELADGGSLFLDEIGEMPIELQPKLLRALQEGEIERVGGTKTIKVDVRTIAATNRNLPKEIEEGNFREDLYYRLNVFPIHSIPLRERKEDIPLLVSYFCEKLGARMGRKITNIPQKVINTLVEYDFPGNIRELENLVERGIIMSKGEKLSIGSWFNPKKNIKKAKKLQTLEEVQRSHIIEVLEHTNWKVSGKGGAADILDMRPTTLFSKIDRLEIKRKFDFKNI